MAGYINENLKNITAMKMHKIVYYAQACNLVWNEKELFKEDFQAWTSSPTSTVLYKIHKGKFKISMEKHAMK